MSGHLCQAMDRPLLDATCSRVMLLLERPENVTLLKRSSCFGSFITGIHPLALGNPLNPDNPELTNNLSVRAIRAGLSSSGAIRRTCRTLPRALQSLVPSKESSLLPPLEPSNGGRDLAHRGYFDVE